MTLHPTAIAHHRANVETLAAAINNNSDQPHSAELAAALRGLIKAVVLHPNPRRRGLHIELQGRLAELTGAFLLDSLSGVSFLREG
ncbi:MAG: hypothetical protein JOZ94_21940 [Xanthobacteraceae bacterium]|nr:hypothetical protein [Xanthobacteraceae bacterium]